MTDVQTQNSAAILTLTPPEVIAPVVDDAIATDMSLIGKTDWNVPWMPSPSSGLSLSPERRNKS